MSHDSSSADFSRRTFLLGAAAGAVLLRSTPAAQAQPQKVRLGIIGCGGQGEYNWSNVADEDVRVLCDVDLERTIAAKARFPNAEVVQDFRRIITRDDIDAVVVSTPDHWHAIPSVWAMRSGKHVYCEKPLAKSIWEVRTMADTARRRKLVTQMGTQIHAGNNYRRVVELIRAGAIGTVERVEVWCEARPSPGRRLQPGEVTPPTTLDYELWQGPAPRLPFNPAVVPFHWRWWWEFGGGVLADMACHFMDLPHWALDLRHPRRVSATGTPLPNADNPMPVEMRVDFHYPEREGEGGTRPPVHLTWWHGIPGPRDEAGKVRDYGLRSGVLFTGTEGQLAADYGSHKLLPEEKFRDYRREWLNAIREGTPTTCNFDYSGALAETVLLGNVAYRLGKEIEWDARGMKVKNARERDWKPLVRTEYHGDWKLKP
jgi:predicted dehydrogenase